MRVKEQSWRTVSVILAAGRGVRMRSLDRPKVCFPVDGVPAITRAVTTCARCGIQAHFLVVGPGAEQVMQAVAAAPGHHIFCHQAEQRGTGHAARTAAALLRSLDYREDILVVAGDKVLDQAPLFRLMDAFDAGDCDLAFLVGDARDFPTAGRVVCDEDGQALGIVETPDIARAQLLQALDALARERDVTAEEARNLALAHLKQEKKAALALGPLWSAIASGRALTRKALDRHFPEQERGVRVNGRRLPPEALSGARHANLSVYLFRAPALYAALDRLTADNAQKEEYLTDVVGILAGMGGRVRAVPVDRPEQVMAFNTPEELEAIEEHLAERKRVAVREEPRAVRSAREWLSGLGSGDTDAVRWLAGTYGAGSPCIEDRRARLVALLRSYLGLFGNGPVVLARAPGRVNIMGRHVDHQGGHGNMIAIDRDVWMVAGARADRQVHLHNLDSGVFPERCFDLDGLLAGYGAGGWRAFVDGAPVREQAAAARGDWAQYAKAAVARMQAHFAARPLAGMNVAVAGSIPMAAGLSSSSALVVALAEALLAINGLDLEPERFVELCGEGEWYVGTRGGAGDHAAMKFARRGQVAQVGFFPFGVTDTVPFPPGYQFLLCNSRQQARKTEGARDQFNHRVACYHLGRELLKREFPHLAHAVVHLRDVNAENLGVCDAQVLAMLKRLPVCLTREEVIVRLSPETAAPFLGTHDARLDRYPLRPVVLFGLAECARSRACTGLLRRGEVDAFGRWMDISHDGDRVSRGNGRGGSRPFAADCSDSALGARIAAWESGREESTLAALSGGYACSTPEIDGMVDIALSVEGVAGAQIAGAGLGGFMMALAREEACERLREALTRGYYEPAGLEPDMFACYPMSGSGIAAW